MFSVTRHRVLWCLMGSLLLVSLTGVSAQAGVITPELQAVLDTRGPAEAVAVIVTLSAKVDLELFQDRDKSLRRSRLIRELKRQADTTQQPLRTFLRSQGITRLKQLHMINGLAFTAPVHVIQALARYPGIASIKLDAVLRAPTATLNAVPIVEWNLQAIRAPELWDLGHTGQGVVVASMDTGVDLNHPELRNKWRGGSNSWFDPRGEHITPYDANGHGTQTMGIIVGGTAGGPAIGVAPAAQWIAVKIFDDAGQALLSDIHLGFQWLLDPDENPNTNDAPDIVNNSWGLTTTAQCVEEFRTDIQSLKTAGIAVVFSAGNNGPGIDTSTSPANYPESVSVGAVDASLSIASFSSRGSSACDSLLVYPTMVAPGVQIRTTDLTFGGLFPDAYVAVTGTSFAAPHITGAMALLLSAFPHVTVAALEAVLHQSAVDLGPAGPEVAYGYGLMDVLGAYLQVADTGGGPVAVADGPYTVDEDTPRTVEAPGVLANDTGTGTLTAVLVSPTNYGSLTLAPNGAFTYQPGPNFVGTDLFTYQVTNGTVTSSTVATVTLTVTSVNDTPVAVPDAYSATGGSALSVTAPGVLKNDTDVDDDVLVARLQSGPSGGTLSLNSDGSFVYTPNAGTTTDSFTYTANDGLGDSVPATVVITIVPNTPPVAKNDIAVTRRDTRVTINVVANDTDADGSIVPSSVKIVAAPARGGTAVPRANGTVLYTPPRAFIGTDTFTYTVKDNVGATSNVATVQVNVRR